MWWNCPSCSKSVDDVWAYCPYCGGALFETCRECGKKEPICRPICLTRLDIIKSSVEKHAILYTEKNKHEGRSVRSWRNTMNIWIGNNFEIFWLSTMVSLTFGFILLNNYAGGKIGLVAFVVMAAFSLLVIVNVFIDALIPVEASDDASLARLKKEGMREYYKNHPEEYAMLRLIQANKSTPDISHVLAKIL